MQATTFNPAHFRAVRRRQPHASTAQVLALARQWARTGKPPHGLHAWHRIATVAAAAGWVARYLRMEWASSTRDAWAQSYRRARAAHSGHASHTTYNHLPV